MGVQGVSFGVSREEKILRKGGVGVRFSNISTPGLTFREHFVIKICLKKF
jgi:hypothetical protein